MFTGKVTEDDKQTARVMARLCAGLSANRREEKAKRFKAVLKEPELLEVFDRTYDKQTKKIRSRISH